MSHLLCTLGWARSHVVQPVPTFFWGRLSSEKVTTEFFQWGVWLTYINDHTLCIKWLFSPMSLTGLWSMHKERLDTRLLLDILSSSKRCWMFYALHAVWSVMGDLCLLFTWSLVLLTMQQCARFVWQTPVDKFPPLWGGRVSTLWKCRWTNTFPGIEMFAEQDFVSISTFQMLPFDHQKKKLNLVKFSQYIDLQGVCVHIKICALLFFTLGHVPRIQYAHIHHIHTHIPWSSCSAHP